MRNLSVSVQLRLLGGAFAVAFLVLVAWTAIGMNRGEQLSATALDRSVERLGRAIRMEGYVYTNVARIRAVAASSDPTLESLFRTDIAATEQAFVKDLRYVEALRLTEAEQQTLAKLKADTTIAIGSTEKVRQLKLQGQLAAAREVLTGEFDPAAAGLLSAAGRFQELQRDAVISARQQLASTTRGTLWWSTVLGIALGASILLFIELLRRQIGTALNQVAGFASRAAAGDLTGTVTSTRRDEIGVLVNAVSTMNRSLGMLVSRLRDSSVRIQALSGDIASGSEELSRRTERTAASLQETAASMEEIAGTSRHCAVAGQRGRDQASTTASTALEGRHAMERVTSTMMEIGSASAAIGSIIAEIDSISFQTNLLALNAAVEAARAGDQGKGFAVVAEQVRGLARRSASNAQAVRSLIGSCNDKVREGTEMVDIANRKIEVTTVGIQRVSVLTEEITHLAGEQKAGIDQVAAAVADLDDMAQKNATFVQRTTATAASLREEAATLAALVGRFQIPSQTARTTPDSVPDDADASATRSIGSIPQPFGGH